MPIISIGKLRHLATFQKLMPSSPPTYDEAGQTQVWTPTGQQALVAVDILSARDAIRNGLTITELYADLTMYWQPGITNKLRAVMDNGAIYVIRSVQNILEMNAVLVVNCVGLQQYAA